LHDIGHQRSNGKNRPWLGAIGCDAQNALVKRLHFLGGFVTFDGEEQIARFHAVAILLEPLAKRAFFHRPTQAGHEDFGCHSFDP